MESIAARSLSTLESDLFRGLNSFIEPLVRAGFGSPGPCTSGVILVETIGRKSGRATNVPLMAAAFGNLVVVSTVRATRSQWIKNLAANPEVRFWAHGRAHAATAFVIGNDTEFDRAQLPSSMRGLARLLRSLTIGNDLAFAVLMPTG
jgi:deazaflavin-dependent oxidoreductase (nitroreductase family)